MHFTPGYEVWSPELFSEGTQAACLSHGHIIVLKLVFTVEQKREGSTELPECRVLTVKKKFFLISPNKFTLVSAPTSMALFKCHLKKKCFQSIRLSFHRNSNSSQ